jgi:hypothetical protein
VAFGHLEPRGGNTRKGNLASSVIASQGENTVPSSGDVLSDQPRP